MIFSNCNICNERGDFVGDISIYNYGTDFCAHYDFMNKEKCIKNHIAYMLNRTSQMFKYENLPKTITRRNLELMLQRVGYSCFTKVDGEYYIFYGGLGGEPNEYYMPTKCIVNNPALHFNKELKIDHDCVIIPNDSLYYGLLPMFERYATMLTENEISILMCDYNMRQPDFVTAPDDTTKRSADTYFNDLINGKFGVVGDNAFLDGIKVHPRASTSAQGMLTGLLEIQQYYSAGWFNQLGLDANFNMKREALNTSESQMNKDALIPLIDDMLNCRKEAIEKINTMYELNISVDFASAWKDNEIELENAQESTRVDNEEETERGEENETE